MSSESDMVLILNRITEASKKYPRNNDTFLGYAVAGVRNKEVLLDHVMFRMGIMAAIRSKVTKATIGAMITASHNPAADNGLKMIDPAGEMLATSWEGHATVLSNVDNQELGSTIQGLMQSENVDLNVKSSLFVGRDTRESGIRFTEALELGFRCVEGDGGHFVDYGVVSTPLLHFMVVCANNPGDFEGATPNCYYSRLANAFNKLMTMKPRTGSYVPSLVFDGSNGVGALAMIEFVKRIPKDVLEIKIYNDGKSGGILNHKCGADFIKTERMGSENVPRVPSARCVSFDGDADRIIYFYYDEAGSFQLVDGDKIAVLFALHFGELVKASGITTLKLGLVQTAYANGSSTDYIQNEMGIPVSFAGTGVKHLHHVATTQFDIGIYFEANGHGTVVFSDAAVAAINRAAEDEGNLAAVELANLMLVINPYVGDALSDMLGVEAILHSRGWSIEDWNSCYTDFPNRLSKVTVQDRLTIQYKEVGREVQIQSPPGLQEILNTLSAKYKNGRCFFRPSGTEDLVRVYAEAETQENADLLGAEVCQLVYNECNGIGPRPQFPN